MNWRAVRPIDVIKWMAVIFTGCVMVLVIVAIILAMFGVF